MSENFKENKNESSEVEKQISTKTKSFEFDKSVVNTQLLDAFLLLNDEVASGRTRKYFTGDARFNERLQDVLQTIEGLRTAYGSSVVVDGEVYNRSDYLVPKKLKDYVNSGRIYASKDAIGVESPIFESEKVNIPLSPEAFHHFFTEFNGTQGEDKKFILVESLTKENLTLEDLQYLEDESGLQLAKLREEAICDSVTCQLMGYRLDSLTKYLRKYAKYNPKGILKWLFE